MTFLAASGVLTGDFLFTFDSSSGSAGFLGFDLLMLTLPALFLPYFDLFPSVVLLPDIFASVLTRFEAFCACS